MVEGPVGWSGAGLLQRGPILDRSGPPRDSAQPLEDWYETAFEPGLVLNGMDGAELWAQEVLLF